jgi:hypothetical protein
MHPYIKKLRSKPEHVKKSILFVALAVSMTLVFLIWSFNLNDRFEKQKVVEKSREDVKPFSMLIDSISSTIGNISKSVSSAPSIKEKVIESKTQEQINNDIQQPVTQSDTSINNQIQN